MLPANWPVVELFLAVQTQWRIGPVGGVLGLDYPAVDVAIRRLGLETTPEHFEGLQVMERTVIEALAKQRKQGGD